MFGPGPAPHENAGEAHFQEPRPASVSNLLEREAARTLFQVRAAFGGVSASAAAGVDSAAAGRSLLRVGNATGACGERGEQDNQNELADHVFRSSANAK